MRYFEICKWIQVFLHVKFFTIRRVYSIKSLIYNEFIICVYMVFRWISSVFLNISWIYLSVDLISVIPKVLLVYLPFLLMVWYSCWWASAARSSSEGDEWIPLDPIRDGFSFLHHFRWIISRTYVHNFYIYNVMITKFQVHFWLHGCTFPMCQILFENLLRNVLSTTISHFSSNLVIENLLIFQQFIIFSSSSFYISLIYK